MNGHIITKMTTYTAHTIEERFKVSNIGAISYNYSGISDKNCETYSPATVSVALATNPYDPSPDDDDDSDDDDDDEDEDNHDNDDNDG